MTPEQRSVIGRRLIALREELLGRGPSKIEPNRRDDATTGVADEDEQALSEMHQVLASHARSSS
jgi:DnaK suppressor protein